MSKLWKYNNWEENKGCVLIEDVYKPKYVYQDVEPSNDYTEVIDEDELNMYRESNADLFTDYAIFNLIHDYIKQKCVHDINYITELKSKIKLHPVQVLTDSGLLQKTEWYYGYINPLNKGILILIVEEEYVTQPEDDGLNPTARTVISRVKTRKWAKKNGDIDSSNKKVTPKNYDTSRKRNKEGKRRRENIIDVLAEHTAMGGILSGIFVDENDANDKLTLIMEEFSSAITTYIKTGRGTLFSLMTNDINHAWLDSLVIDSPQTQAMTPFMIGLDLRSYITNKLKGIIK